MTGPVARQHVAGLMLEAAIKEEPYRPNVAVTLLRLAAILERGPDVASVLFPYALGAAEPFIARAVHDLLGAGRENGEEIVREALVTR